MSESFDVAVVGARCAGASLALGLARAGLRVALLDKDRFPSDTPSTHGIQPAGVRLLERLGVLDQGSWSWRPRSGACAWPSTTRP